GYFAQHKEALAQQGITVMVAASSVIESCLDKFKFAQMLEQYGFPGIPTELSLDALSGERFVVKERYGAGSHNMGVNLTRPEAQEVAKRLKNPVFQPYIQGKEYSIDFYATLQHQAHGIIVRERTLVRHGESQISITL